MSIGLKFLVSLIDSDHGLDQYARMRPEGALFMGEAEKEFYEFVSGHVLSYSKLPSRGTCKEEGHHLLPPAQPEPPEYYFSKVRERYVFYQLKVMLKGVESELNDDQPSNALGRMVDTMSLCQMMVHKDRLIDFTKEALSTLEAEYKYKQHHGDDHGLHLGWSEFDNMTGGLQGGDLITMVGRPGAGKTYLMLHAANHAWQRNLVPLFVSMEMKPLLIMQRIAAMLTKTPITGIKHAALPTKLLNNMTNKLKGIAKSKIPYWIVDGSLTSTVNDVVLLSRQLKPGVVFIDGAYLLRSTSRVPRWERLTENAERLKGELAEALNIPVVISYQFNREVKKGAKAENVGLENIAYTDAIGQLSSVVLGLLQDESVETLMRRRIEILKGRNGEQGSFEVHWIFDTGPNFMDFSEVYKPKTKEQGYDEKGNDLAYV